MRMGNSPEAFVGIGEGPAAFSTGAFECGAGLAGDEAAVFGVNGRFVRLDGAFFCG